MEDNEPSSTGKKQLLYIIQNRRKPMLVKVLRIGDEIWKNVLSFYYS